VYGHNNNNNNNVSTKCRTSDAKKQLESNFNINPSVAWIIKYGCRILTWIDPMTSLVPIAFSLVTFHVRGPS